MKYRMVLELVPMTTTNANMILTPQGKSGPKRPMVMKTAEARKWMKSAVDHIGLWRNVHRVPVIEQPVRVSIDVYRKVDAGDIDNYAKGVLDALQEAQVIRNDRLVTELLMRKFTDPRRPRYEIEVEVLGGTAPMFNLP